MEMEFNTHALLATLNPLVLAGCLAAAAVIGIICAYLYRNTNDFAKSSRLFAVLGLMMGVSLFFFRIPVILIAAVLVCGFVVMALSSNYFFYHR